MGEPDRAEVRYSETGLVESAVLAGKHPFPRGIEPRLKIVDRIEALVAGSAVTDFKIQDVECGAVDELVRPGTEQLKVLLRL